MVKSNVKKLAVLAAGLLMGVGGSLYQARQAQAICYTGIDCVSAPCSLGWKCDAKVQALSSHQSGWQKNLTGARCGEKYINSWGGYCDTYAGGCGAPAAQSPC